MYYPIIDKLKTLMTDIASVKEKEPLVIVGTMTSTTGGTYTGNYSDIAEAFSINRQVLFKVAVQGDTLLIPIFDYNSGFSVSVCFPFNADGGVVFAYSTIEANNSFTLHTMR